MERMKGVKWDRSVDDGTEKRVVFIDLPLMITIFLDLSALKVKPAIHDHFLSFFKWHFSFFKLNDINLRDHFYSLFKWNLSINAQINPTYFI